MTAVDDFADEFVREDGFFFGLHQRQFDPVAAERALQVLRQTEIGADHSANYRLAEHLFSAEVELATFRHYNRDNKLFGKFYNLLFFEIAERFNAISRLGQAMREK